MKLNSFFHTFTKNIDSSYNFKLKFGGFGTEQINLNGTIEKRKIVNNNDEKTNNTFYLIEINIDIKFGNDKGTKFVFMCVITFYFFLI